MQEVKIIDDIDDFSNYKPVLLEINFCNQNLLTNLRVMNNKIAN